MLICVTVINAWPAIYGLSYVIGEFLDFMYIMVLYKRIKDKPIATEVSFYVHWGIASYHALCLWQKMAMDIRRGRAATYMHIVNVTVLAILLRRYNP